MRLLTCLRCKPCRNKLGVGFLVIVGFTIFLSITRLNFQHKKYHRQDKQSLIRIHKLFYHPDDKIKQRKHVSNVEPHNRFQPLQDNKLRFEPSFDKIDADHIDIEDDEPEKHRGQKDAEMDADHIDVEDNDGIGQHKLRQGIPGENPNGNIFDARKDIVAMQIAPPEERPKVREKDINAFFNSRKRKYRNKRKLRSRRRRRGSSYWLKRRLPIEPLLGPGIRLPRKKRKTTTPPYFGDKGTEAIQIVRDRIASEVSKNIPPTAVQPHSPQIQNSNSIINQGISHNLEQNANNSMAPLLKQSISDMTLNATEGNIVPTTD